MTKIRQHHVWQRYLKSWAEDEKLFCLNTQSKEFISREHTKNVAVMKKFYSIENINRKDINVLTELIKTDKRTDKKTKIHHQSLIDDISNILDRKELKQNDFPGIDKQKIKKDEINFLEDRHAKIEEAFIPILEKILDKKIEFYNQENDCFKFFIYLATQYMRTSAMKEKELKYIKEHYNEDLSKVWNILALIAAYNMGNYFFSQRKKLKLLLLENKTTVDFLTADQPVVNLISDPLNPCLYYPISPKIAIILQEEKKPIFQTHNLTEDDIDILNKKIIKSKSTQIFSLKEETIIRYYNIDSEYFDINGLMKSFFEGKPSNMILSFNMNLLDDDSSNETKGE